MVLLSKIRKHNKVVNNLIVAVNNTSSTFRQRVNYTHYTYNRPGELNVLTFLTYLYLLVLEK